MKLHNLISDGSLFHICGPIKLKACSAYNELTIGSTNWLDAADLRERHGLYGTSSSLRYCGS
jgi:hypothetical protein